jgi:hypothetical protein
LNTNCLQSSDYIAIASALVALLALGATVWQGFVTRQHNRLSVRPLLVWHVARGTSVAGAELVFIVKNRGIGPALITDRYFTVNNQRFVPSKPQTDEVLEVVHSVLGSKYQYDVRQWGLPGKGAALPAQEEVVVARIAFPAMSHEQLSSLMREIKNIRFFLRYECLYGKPLELKTDDLTKGS